MGLGRVCTPETWLCSLLSPVTSSSLGISHGPDCSSRSTHQVSVCLSAVLCMQCSEAAPAVGDSRDTMSVDRQTLCAEVPSDASS